MNLPPPHPRRSGGTPPALSWTALAGLVWRIPEGSGLLLVCVLGPHPAVLRNNSWLWVTLGDDRRPCGVPGSTPVSHVWDKKGLAFFNEILLRAAARVICGVVPSSAKFLQACGLGVPTGTIAHNCPRPSLCNGSPSSPQGVYRVFRVPGNSPTVFLQTVSSPQIWMKLANASF